MKNKTINMIKIILFAILTMVADVTLVEETTESAVVSTTVATNNLENVTQTKLYETSSESRSRLEKPNQVHLLELTKAEQSTTEVINETVTEEDAIVKRSPSYESEQNSKSGSSEYDDDERFPEEAIKSTTTNEEVDDKTKDESTDTSEPEVTSALAELVDLLTSTEESSVTVENSNYNGFDGASTYIAEADDTVNTTEDESNQSSEVENKNRVSRHGNYEDQESEDVVRQGRPDVFQRYFPGHRTLLGAELGHGKEQSNLPAEFYGEGNAKPYYEQFRDSGANKMTYGNNAVFPTSTPLRYPTYKNPQETSQYFYRRNNAQELPNQDVTNDHLYSNAYPYTPLRPASSERAWYPENAATEKNVLNGYYHGYEQNFNPFSQYRHGHRHRRSVPSPYLYLSYTS